MNRTLTSHQVNPANDTLGIRVIDEPGSRGANHAYMIEGFDNRKNSSDVDDMDANQCLILFQNGPIAEVGVNGITHEALLAILIDRLEGFQAGPYASEDNSLALSGLRQAQTCLQRRTRERMARGVEGTHTI